MKRSNFSTDPKSLWLSAAGIGFALISTSTFSADERRQLDSHEHGVTIVNIAQENGVLELELEAPAMNVVGFEYAPTNADQKQAVNDALALMKTADKMFALNPEAECSLESATAEHIVEDGHDVHGDEHETDHDDHDDEHADKESGHAEFIGQYRYVCQQPDKLAQLKAVLLESFPLTNEVEASYVGPQNQNFKTLTTNKPVLQVQP